MKASKWFWGLKFMIMGAAFFTLLTLAVMGLWNWLAPALWGGGAISFLQAFGLLVLSRLLLGGFWRGGWGKHHHWRHKFQEKWEKMTPEEREKWKTHMSSWCGSHRCGTTRIQQEETAGTAGA